MKIKNLKIKGFRGVNNQIEVAFSPGLNLVYAPNGWGKSSIAEAIEWTIFANTQRNLDAKSKIEFEGSYRNIHLEPNDIACVEMKCQDSNQDICFLRLMYSNGDVSFTIIPESYLLTNCRVRPIIYQHALQRFIHTEPKNRWDEFANILGLTDLENLRDILIKVKNNKDDSIPDELRQSFSKLLQFRSIINSFPQLKDLKKPVEQNAKVFWESVAKLGEKIVSSEGGNKADLANELKRILTKRQNAIFNISIFSLQALDQALKQQYENDKNYILKFNKDALEKIKEYREQRKDELDSRRFAFIKSGLELLPPQSEICPFCRGRTITDELREKLLSEIKASSETSELHQKIVYSLVQMKSKIINIANQLIPKMRSAPAVQANLPKIRKMLEPEGKDMVDSLEQAIKQIINESQELISLKETATNAVESIESHFDLTDFDETFIKNLIANIGLFINKTDLIKDNLLFYESLYNTTKERLEKEMSARHDIAVPDFLINVLSSAEEIQQAFLVEKCIGQLDNLRQKVEDFHKKKTAEKLQEKKEDILKWYEILNPKENVGFTGIREHPKRKRWLEIMAHSYGEEMSGPACLSESHLNAVGISVYLGQILGTLGPFQFLIIDDPVQSMDEKHSRRFGDIIEAILVGGYQIILLSHQNEIIDMLRNSFQDNLDFGELEIINYDKSGPVIQEKIPPFHEYLKQAKKFRTGDATCRAAAFNFLRKATERLSKDVNMGGTQTQLAKRYEQLDAEKMEKLLVDSGIPQYSEIISMRETLKFSGPPSHDDMSKNPPTPEELERHISRLEMLRKRWCPD